MTKRSKNERIKSLQQLQQEASNTEGREFFAEEAERLYERPSQSDDRNPGVYDNVMNFMERNTKDMKTTGSFLSGVAEVIKAGMVIGGAVATASTYMSSRQNNSEQSMSAVLHTKQVFSSSNNNNSKDDSSSDDIIIDDSSSIMSETDLIHQLLERGDTTPHIFNGTIVQVTPEEIQLWGDDSSFSSDMS